MKIVTIAAVQGGWTVSSEGLADIVVKSGAKAEAAAERLAMAMASTGAEVEIRVHLAHGTHVGRIVAGKSVRKRHGRGGPGVH